MQAKPVRPLVRRADAKLSWDEWEDELLQRLRTVENQLRASGVSGAMPGISRLRSRLMQLFEDLR